MQRKKRKVELYTRNVPRNVTQGRTLEQCSVQAIRELFLKNPENPENFKTMSLKSITCKIKSIRGIL